MKYEVQEFNIPPIDGLSDEQIKVHLGLYKGYVTHVNLIAEKLGAMRNGAIPNDAYVGAELRRRFAFEFGGMRMHENYFEQLQSGGARINENGLLANVVNKKYGDTDKFLEHIKEVAGSRGIGWVIVYYDLKADTVHTVFAGDHELGHLSGLPILYCIDMWEHAFMVDYTPSEKAKYLDVYLSNTNWKVAEDRLAAVK